MFHRSCTPSSGTAWPPVETPTKSFENEKKCSLRSDLQTKKNLCHNNLTKIIGHVTVDQHRQSRSCGNHPFVFKNIAQVDTTLSEEERNKCAAVLPCWLESFFPDLCLTRQVLIFKEGKNDRLVSN